MMMAAPQRSDGYDLGLLLMRIFMMIMMMMMVMIMKASYDGFSTMEG